MMTAHFCALLCGTLFTWAGYGLACLGYGSLWKRICRLTDSKPSDFIWSFWIGLGTILGLLQIWHLRWPMNGYAMSLVLLVGLLLCLRALASLFGCVAKIPKWQRRLFLLLLFVVAIWIADRAAGPDAFYDAGLYQIPAMKWASQYAVVPGLANLHLRLGFTSSIPLFAAMMNQGIWAGSGNHLLNGFFLIGLAAMVLRAAVAVIADGATRRPDHWLMIFPALAVIEWAMDNQASSYSTDIAAMAFPIVASAAFLQSRVSIVDPPRQLFQVLACCTLCAMAISAKASTVPFVVPLAIGALAQIVASNRGAVRRLTDTAVAIALAVFIGCGWVVSQVILTGYPLFPMTMLPTSVDWRVDKGDVAATQRMLLDYSRVGKKGDTTHDYSWIRRWIHVRVLHSWNIWKGLIPFALGTILLGLALIWRRWGGRWDPQWAAIHWVIVSAAIGIVAWFRTAPDPRYASHLFYLWFAAGASLIGIRLLGQKSSIWRRLLPLTFACTIALGPVITQLTPGDSLRRVLHVIWVSPDPQAGGFGAEPPQSHLREETLPGGVVVYIPPDGSDQVWDAPLPNAPYPNPGLRLRHPPNIQDGFRIPPRPPGAPGVMETQFGNGTARDSVIRSH